INNPAAINRASRIPTTNENLMPIGLDLFRPSDAFPRRSDTQPEEKFVRRPIPRVPDLKIAPPSRHRDARLVPHHMAAMNKCLAKSNKSHTGRNATKERDPPTDGYPVRLDAP